MDSFNSEEIIINIKKVKLNGSLTVIKGGRGIVIFCHGSGSSRLSPRNIFVAEQLNRAGISTLLFDLLTEKEDEIYDNRFDIPLLAKRLVKVTEWVTAQKSLADFKIGLFGASTGAAAALIAAADIKESIKAVVSRGGRPDLALDHLSQVIAPTLLIVGGDDKEVIELNKMAYNELSGLKELSIVPGATHLFEEPGTLEQVAKIATNWFLKYLK